MLINRTLTLNFKCHQWSHAYKNNRLSDSAVLLKWKINVLLKVRIQNIIVWRSFHLMMNSYCKEKTFDLIHDRVHDLVIDDHWNICLKLYKNFSYVMELLSKAHRCWRDCKKNITVMGGLSSRLWNESQNEAALLNGSPGDRVTHWSWDKMANMWQKTLFKCIFLKEHVCIFIQISLKFVCMGTIGNKSSLI